MSSTLQRIFGTACIVLLSGALAACGGSDTGSATPAAAKAAAAEAKEAPASAAAASEKSAAASVKSAAASEKSAAASTNSAAAPQQAATAVATAGPDLVAGEKIYGRFCFSCHAAGVASAPKLGVAADWAPRVAKGLDMMVASTIKGIAPGMPARGLCMNCTDDDLRNTVAWMITQQ